MQTDGWHSLAAEQALQRLESTTQGLSKADAQQRLAKYGPNTIPEKRRRALWRILLQQFSDFMIIVSLGGVDFWIYRRATRHDCDCGDRVARRWLTTIVLAIRAGRTVFNDIRKFIKHTKSSNSG